MLEQARLTVCKSFERDDLLPHHTEQWKRAREKAISDWEESPGQDALALLPVTDPFQAAAHILHALAHDRSLLLLPHDLSLTQWDSLGEQLCRALAGGESVTPIDQLGHGEDSLFFLHTTLRQRPPQATILIPTSGQSGGLKVCVHSTATLLSSVQATVDFYGISILSAACFLPMYHVSGLMQVVRAAVTGGQLWLGSRVEWEEVSASMLQSVTLTSLVPGLLAEWMSQPEMRKKLGQLKIVFCGGAPADPALKETLKHRQIPVSYVYGATETASMVAGTRPAVGASSIEPPAMPLPHASFEVDADGVLWVRAESLFHGYLHDWETVMNTPPKIWKSHDYARIGENGTLQLLGRADHVILTGGENLFPEELEQVLRAHPKLDEVCVVGIPHQKWGEAVACTYVAKSPSRLPSENELREWVRNQVATWKCPKYWLACSSLPKAKADKIQRDAVRAMIMEKIG